MNISREETDFLPQNIQISNSKNSRSLPRFKFQKTKPFLGKFYYDTRKKELDDRLGFMTTKHHNNKEKKF